MRRILGGMLLSGREATDLAKGCDLMMRMIAKQEEQGEFLLQAFLGVSEALNASIDFHAERECFCGGDVAIDCPRCSALERVHSVMQEHNLEELSAV